MSYRLTVWRLGYNDEIVPVTIEYDSLEKAARKAMLFQTKRDLWRTVAIEIESGDDKPEWP